MDAYAGKAEVREYLAALNKDTKVSGTRMLCIATQAPKVPEKTSTLVNLAEIQVLEYCLFQPGLFINYFAHPHRTAKHLTTFQMQFDFQNRRAIVRGDDGGDDDRLSLITVQDLAAVVARAVEYEGTWPVVGGIRGCEVSVSELIRLGEEIRGKCKPFDFKRLSAISC